MDTTNMGHLAQQGYVLLLALGIKILEALALWIVGRWLIGFSIRLIDRALTRQKIDPTLIRYINNAVAAILNIVLVIAILGFFGVETTSFAALQAFAPILVHATPRFFVGFGPSLYAELSDEYAYANVTGQNRKTEVGLGLVVGGSL